MVRLSIPPSAKEKIEADINRRSLGIFLWAVLVIKILREKRDDGAALTELTNSLAIVPDKLGSLFARILEHSDKDTIVAFQWVLFARFPLSLHELYFAIKTSTGQLITGEWDKVDVDQGSIERFITRTTRGLVEAVQEPYRNKRRVTQFIHESVREHLLQGGLANLAMGDPHLIEGLSHAQIARCCLSYILLDPSKYSQHLRSHQGRPWMLSQRFPLQEYVRHNLIYHADLAYRAGMLSLMFVSELPLRLLICISLLMSYHKSIVEFPTILVWLINGGGCALEEALLAGCSMTEKPGILSCEAIANSPMALDINMGCTEECGVVLGAAASFGHNGLVRQLLHLGVPFDRGVRSPLIFATQRRHKDIVELLLRHGANVDAVSNGVSSKTALIIAVREKDYDIASILLAYGPDLHHRCNYGTALDYALSGKDTEMIRLLWDVHFPEREWGASKTEEHRYDAVTVHDITYHTANERNSGYETGSDDSSNISFISDDSNESSKSITSVRTI